MALSRLTKHLHASLPPVFLAPALQNRAFSASSRRSAVPTPKILPIPSPTPFVPDHNTFLTLIGRQMSQQASKIPSWEALFTLSSTDLKEMGVEPARSRRYLLWWRDRFRRGLFGIGGDLKYVRDGVAEVRVVEKADGRRQIVNVEITDEGDGETERTTTEPKVYDPAVVSDLKIKGAGEICGSYFQAVKGSEGRVARIRITDGLWEVKRGRKVHGGERRRKNVLSRIAARVRGTLK